MAGFSKRATIQNTVTWPLLLVTNSRRGSRDDAHEASQVGLHVNKQSGSSAVDSECVSRCTRSPVVCAPNWPAPLKARRIFHPCSDDSPIPYSLPLPVSATFCLATAALSTTVRSVERGPLWLGAKVTEITQSAPGESELGQALLRV
jgi:hypothetical protein